MSQEPGTPASPPLLDEEKNNNDLNGNNSEGDDDDENNKQENEEVAVDSYKFAEDDRTVDVPYPVKHIMLLPKALQKLVDYNGNNSNNNNNNNNSATTEAIDDENQRHPLKLFKAPHPRHGEPVVFLGANFRSAAVVASSSSSSVASCSADQKVSMDDGAGDADFINLPTTSSGNNDSASSTLLSTAAGGGEGGRTSDDDYDGANTVVEGTSSSSSSTCFMRIFEVQSRKPLYGSWFVDDNVEPSSPLFIVSPLHPAFIALRLLVTDAVSTMGTDDFLKRVAAIASSSSSSSSDSATTSSSSSSSEATGLAFRASDDWTARANQFLFGDNSGSQQQQPFPNIWRAYLKEGFDCICETKDICGEDFYRFSLTKTRDWLQQRFARIVRCKAFDHLVFNTTTTTTTTTTADDKNASSSSSEGNPASSSSSASSGGNELLRERAIGLLLEYVPNQLPASHVRRWCLGEKRAATNVLAAKAMPASFTKEEALRQENAAEGDTDYTQDQLKKKKIEEMNNTSKSANVKRLEKAGAPKGTPSIAAFFKPKK